MMFLQRGTVPSENTFVVMSSESELLGLETAQCAALPTFPTQSVSSVLRYTSL